MSWILITLTIVAGALDAKIHSVHGTMISCFQERELVVKRVDQAVCVRDKSAERLGPVRGKDWNGDRSAS
tara:strand:- start:154397 stop:154606 length:210 start_codon:yes stop_codon:yes gene_type:complete